jgi:transducin (beta)-like 1
VAFLQKGLQFIELEQAVEAHGCELEYAEPISLLNTAPSRNVVKREAGNEHGGRAGMDVDAEASARGGGGGARERGGGGGGGERERERERERGGVGGDEGMLIPESEVSHLAGHASEVFICAWSPTSSLLASGSGDATARIWSVGDSRDASAPCKAVVLKHSAPDQTRAKDVTTLDWSPNGNFLATGSYDGRARVWTAKGELVNTLGGAPTGGGAVGLHHEGPIFALKWNKASTLLLSGSVDKTAIVWDAATGAVKQHFRLHKAPTLDVDWRDDDSFASCSTDRMVYVCRLGEAGAVRSFAGHTDEVNCVKWSPRGRLLASCSDDCTARIWSVEQNACVHTFGGHSQEIYTIKWSPVRAAEARRGAQTREPRRHGARAVA